MKHQSKHIYQVILIIVGLIMLLAFIWFRFIRPRLPKELPLNLSLLGFCFLVYACAIYLYMIISLLKKSKPVDPLIKQIIESIYIPLEALDHYIKNLNSINKGYKKCIVYLTEKLKYIIQDTNLFYYIFLIIPRIILVTVLFIDVFGYYQLSFIYKVLLVGVFILVGKYIKYSLKYAKEHFLESIEGKIYIVMAYEYASQVIEHEPPEDEDESDYIPETMVVPLKKFVEFQTTTFIEQKEYYPYMSYDDCFDDSYYIRNNLPIPQKFTREEIDTRIKNILHIAQLIVYYDIMHNNNLQIKRLKILIFLNYFICWLYVLLMSFPSLFNASFWELSIICRIQQDVLDPFSWTNIYNACELACA